MNSDAFGEQIPRAALEAEIDAEAHDIVDEMVAPGVGVGIEGDTAQVRSAEVERKIADLSVLRRELGAMVDQCRCGTVAECRIIEALSP